MILLVLEQILTHFPKFLFHKAGAMNFSYYLFKNYVVYWKVYLHVTLEWLSKVGKENTRIDIDIHTSLKVAWIFMDFNGFAATLFTLYPFNSLGVWVKLHWLCTQYVHLTWIKWELKKEHDEKISRNNKFMCIYTLWMGMCYTIYRYWFCSVSQTVITCQ